MRALLPFLLLAACPAAADSLFCKFERLCSSSGCEDAEYFLELRVDEGEAFFNDGERIVPVEIITGKDGLSFLDIDDAGNLSLTTVYQDLSAALSSHGIGREGPSSVLRLGACRREHG